MANLIRLLLLTIFLILASAAPGATGQGESAPMASVPTGNGAHSLATDVPTGDGTHALVAEVPTLGQVWPATCYMCGDGVKREDAAAAANAICQHWWNAMILQGGFGNDGVGYMYGYGGGENIWLLFTPFWQQEGCFEAWNDMFQHYDLCYEGFMKPVDWCNTAGVNGKQGGFWWDQCGTFVFNPHVGQCHDDSKFVAPDTVEHLIASGMEFHAHHASDEEHAAGVAAALDHEQSVAKPRR